MYRHPPPRKCSGARDSEVNKDSHCVSWTWSWHGWVCLYCEHVIGAAADDLPRGTSAKEEATAVWYRDRFRRQDQWTCAVRLGVEMQPWHIGWEPNPLPSNLAAMPMPRPALPSGPMDRATRHLNAMNAANSSAMMSSMQYYLHGQSMPLQVQPVCPLTPSEEDEMDEYLATPDKTGVISVPSSPVVAEEQEQHGAAVSRHVPQADPSAYVRKEVEQVQPVKPLAVQTPTLAPTRNVQCTAPSHLPSSLLSNPTRSPTPLPGTLLPDTAGDDPRSPTSSAIAALLDDDTFDEPAARAPVPCKKLRTTKVPCEKKVASKVHSIGPSVKAVRKHLKTTGARVSGVRKEQRDGTTAHRSRQAAVGTASTGDNDSIQVLIQTTVASKKAAAPTKLWQTMRIPKKAFQAPSTPMNSTVLPTTPRAMPGAGVSQTLPTPDCTPSPSPKGPHTGLPCI